MLLISGNESAPFCPCFPYFPFNKMHRRLVTIPLRKKSTTCAGGGRFGYNPGIARVTFTRSRAQGEATYHIASTS